MHPSLYRVGIGLYLVWLLAVVALVLGRYTPVPLLPSVHAGVVIGTAVLTLFGAGRLVRNGYRRLAD